METRRNWLVWVALGMAGLALVLALGGRMNDRRMAWNMAAGPAPAAAAPDARAERGGPPAFAEGRGGHGGPPAFAEGRGERGGPPMGAAYGMMGQRHGFAPLMMFFGLINALTKLVALGLLAWLLLRLFQQRNAGGPPTTAPAAPTTPAGHDPRVE
jgi:hypothetical protein